ncbi:MAG: trimethylamine methyltransferase family protein [Anaerolineae bacterium]|nr:trimethylamine methyltransferase family protein [Anaerolineae bacterium]
MRRIIPRIALDLAEADLEFIESTAARILEEVGLEVPLSQAREELQGMPGLRLRGDRVHFAADGTLALLGSLRRSAPSVPPDVHLHVSTGGGALRILDHETGELRLPTTGDLLFILRVCDRLGLGGDPPVIPADIPTPLREVALYRLAWIHTRTFTGRDISSVLVGEYVYEMAQAAGKPFRLPLYLISPLRINAENLDVVLHFANRLDGVSVHTMPMPGATAPLLAPAYLSQALAETIGGYQIMRRLLPRVKVSFGLKALAFDPYAGVIGCGSPESLLQGQIEVALLQRYGLTPGHFFWSMAGSADAQAAAERMAGVLMGALAGVRHFGVAGRLQGEAFSLVQLLIDLEIAAYVERVLRGHAWEDQLAHILAEVQAGVETDSFLGSEATVAHYRSEVLQQPFFSRRTLSQRAGRNEPDLHGRIRQWLAQLDLPRSEYQPPEVRAELDRIYRHAEAHLCV